MSKNKIDRTVYKIEHLNGEGVVQGEVWGRNLNDLRDAMTSGWMRYPAAVAYKVTQYTAERLGMDELIEALNGKKPVSMGNELVSVARPASASVLPPEADAEVEAEQVDQALTGADVEVEQTDEADEADETLVDIEVGTEASAEA